MYFSPGLGTVGVGRVRGPVDKGSGASAAPVGAPDPPAAASQCDTTGTCQCQCRLLEHLTENTERNTGWCNLIMLHGDDVMSM